MHLIHFNRTLRREHFAVKLICREILHLSILHLAILHLSTCSIQLVRCGCNIIVSQVWLVVDLPIHSVFGMMDNKVDPKAVIGPVYFRVWVARGWESSFFNHQFTINFDLLLSQIQFIVIVHQYCSFEIKISRMHVPISLIYFAQFYIFLNCFPYKVFFLRIPTLDT